MTADVHPVSSVAPINWSANWLSPWRQWGEPAAHRICAGLTAPQALNEAAQSVWPSADQTPIRFVPQSELPSGEAYESYIFRSGLCPTREGLHDFFNGLAWLHFPHTKRRLNQLHVAQIAQTGIAPVRGPARDGLTLFDENAALLQAPDALWEALLAKDWKWLFVKQRPLWQQTRLVLFGHALLEKLVYPRKPITAHVYRVQTASHSTAEWDAWIACSISAEAFAGKPFAHLPVLGVPGWWSANESPEFYTDSSVFRPPNSR